VARPEDLVPGNCYFRFAFYDRDLLFPFVETLKFVRCVPDEDGERLWLFDDQPDGDPPDDKTLMSCRDADLHQVLDFEGVAIRLREVALDHPLHAALPGSGGDLAGAGRFEELRTHVVAMVADPRPASLTITIQFTDDAFCLRRNEKAELEAMFFPNPRRDPGEEARIRALFQGVRIQPRDDYLADRGRTRVLSYPIGGSAEEIVALCIRILEEVHRLSPKDALHHVARPPGWDG
jgi:hypothetical protein